MYIVIVGAGVIGTSIAKWLISAEHEVSVVETSPTRCDNLNDELGSVTVCGDGTSPNVLTEAGIARADILVASTGFDEDNLAACQLASHHFKVQQTISIVHLQEHEELFTRLGIAATVCVPELLIAQIQEKMVIRDMVHLMSIPGDGTRALVAVEIPEDSPISGQPLKNIELPNGTLVSLVISRDGTTSIADGDTLIHPGDEIIAVASKADEDALRELLIRQSRD